MDSVSGTVMLRIHQSQTSEGVVLRAEGRIVAETLAELEGALRRAPASTGPLTLDLGEVTFVDRSGLELLQTLVRRGIMLAGGSPFVTELMEKRR